MDVYAIFLRTIRRHRLIEPGDRILAAVSGGPDSTALLSLLAELREPPFALAIAHLDHGVRGAAGADDAAFVAELARRHGLELFTERLGARGDDPGGAGAGRTAEVGRGAGTVRTAGVGRGAGTGRTAEVGASDAPEQDLAGGRSPSEAWLRRQRLNFLARTAARWGATRIALGHTRDDQAETFLLNLIRGAGAQGLGGMPVMGPLPGMASRETAGRPEALQVIRPLLFVPRRDIEAWLQDLGITARHDATNTDPRYLRNRVRAELLPLLEELRPGARAAIARAAHLLQDDEAYLEGLAGEALAGAGAPEQGATDLGAANQAAANQTGASRAAANQAAANQGAASLGAANPAAANQGAASLGAANQAAANIAASAGHKPGDRAARNRTFALSVESLRAMPRPLARRVLRRAATEVLMPDTPWAPGTRQIDAVLELVRDGRGGLVDLGGGQVAQVRGGRRGQVTFAPATGVENDL